jgi:hypothetical protein
MAATLDSEVEEGEKQRASHPTGDMVREQGTLRPAMVVRGRQLIDSVTYVGCLFCRF